MDFEAGTLILTALAIVMAVGLTALAALVVWDFWTRGR